MIDEPRAVELRVHDADQGIGAAFVDCPRRHVRVPVLVCRVCDWCLRVSETADGCTASLLCMIR
jgi:hypothetical protein